MAIRIYVLIITLNVNRLNTPTKRQTGRKDQPQEKKKKKCPKHKHVEAKYATKKPMDH